MQILQTLTFWALGGLLLLFALGTLVFRNMIHSFLSFIAALLCVAGVYFSLQADYLGGVQVIVYAGSVAILIVLALFLINRRAGDMTHTNKWRHKWLGSTFAAVLVGGCLVLTDGLLNQYVIAFEAMAMLLLAALVAAIMTATEPEKAENSEQGRVA